MCVGEGNQGLQTHFQSPNGLEEREKIIFD